MPEGDEQAELQGSLCIVAELQRELRDLEATDRDCRQVVLAAREKFGRMASDDHEPAAVRKLASQVSNSIAAAFVVLDEQPGLIEKRLQCIEGRKVEADDAMRGMVGGAQCIRSLVERIHKAEQKIADYRAALNHVLRVADEAWEGEIDDTVH